MHEASDQDRGERSRRAWRSLGAFAAVVVAGLLMLLVAESWSGGSPSNATPAAAGLPAVDTVGVDARRVPAAAATDADATPGSSTERVLEATPEVIHILGRCVAAENGEPLAGCSVSLRQGESEQQITTDTDGLFQFACAFVASSSPDLTCESAGRVPRKAWWGRLVAGQVEDLGDVALPRGFELRGIVVDPFGKPVPGVTMMFNGPPLQLRGGHADQGLAGAISGADGTFVSVDGLAFAGAWHLWIVGGYDLRSPDRFTVDAEHGAEPLRIVVAERPAIAGVCVDGSGVPVANVHLTTDQGGDGFSKENGVFRIIASRGDPGGAARILVVASGASEAIPDESLHPWGTVDVRVVLRPPVVAELTVVTADTGEPVEEFAVICRPDRDLVFALMCDRHGGRHPDGKVTIDQVTRGCNALLVLPAADDLGASEPVFFDGGSAGTRLRVALPRLRPCAVIVSDDAGEVVVGARVDLVCTGGRELSADWSPDRSARGIGSWPFGPMPFERLAQADTDANGMAMLRVGEHRRGLVLRVRAQNCAPLLLPDPPLVIGGAPLRVRLVRTGALAGSVELHGQPHESVHVRLEYRQGGPLPLQLAYGMAVQPDGSFEQRELPAGEVQAGVVLQVSHYLPGGTIAVALASRMGSERTVRIEPGHTAHLELDLGDVRRATLRVTVTLDGVPAAGQSFDLEAQDSGLRNGRYDADANGRFFAGELLPGRYRLLAVSPERRALPMVAAQEVELAPAQTRDVAFTLQARRLQVRLLDAVGKPAADLEVDAQCGHASARMRTDADGGLTFAPAPELPITLRSPRTRLPPGDRGVVYDESSGFHVRADEPALWSLSTQMPQDRSAHEVVLKLPPLPPK
ncbi:MAG TPA: carboxypeptidase-like regulatory domain-containing protein [Planctomycetota bacterium]|nr:carboxypeptidase-like regulatory domain-containing protein [Planctomycetota bacterium]